MKFCFAVRFAVGSDSLAVNLYSVERLSLEIWKENNDAKVGISYSGQYVRV